MAETKLKQQSTARKFYLNAGGAGATLTDNVVVVSGYNYVQATAATSAEVDITFGVTFDAAPYVVGTFVGKNSSTSTTYPPSAGESEVFAIGHVPSTTGIRFYFRRNDEGNLTNAHVYFVCWTAIGVIS